MHNQIISTLQTNGFEAYLVGGYVRDTLLNECPKDADIVTNAPINILLEIFSSEKVDLVGKSFNVLIVNNIEVASYRADCYSSSHELTECISVSTLEEDLARRDLTINAIAMTQDGAIIDPFNGQEDLKQGIIRFVKNADDRIKEDPCRILRACRFLAKIDGYFDRDTFQALIRNKELIKSIAPERIRIEILKAMEYDCASQFFNALAAIEVLDHIFPSLAKCVQLEGGQHHAESVFEHCMIAGDSICPKFPLLKLSSYLHDTGKVYSAAYDEDNEITFHGHEKEGLPYIEQELKNLKFSNEEIRYISNLVRFHMRSLRDITPKAMRRLISALKENDVDYRDYLRLKLSDRRANLKKTPFEYSNIRWMMDLFKTEMNRVEPVAFSVKDLAIDGNDVMEIMGIGPGKTVGIVLNDLLDMVLDDPELNTRDNLVDIVEFEKLKRESFKPTEEYFEKIRELLN